MADLPISAVGTRASSLPDFFAPASAPAVSLSRGLARDELAGARPSMVVASNIGLAHGLRKPDVVTRVSDDPMADLRKAMHSFVGHENLDTLGIDSAWAHTFIDGPAREPSKESCATSFSQCGSQRCKPTMRRQQRPKGKEPEVIRGPGAEAVITRAKIASPGRLSSREANQVRADLRKLHFATGPSGSSGAWDSDAFEGYKDFVERAMLAGKLTPEVAYSAKSKDIETVKALLRSTAKADAPDASMMASPAQATISATVGPEWTTRVIVTRHKKHTVHTTQRVSTGHKNNPEDVAKVRHALHERGFDVSETGDYDAALQKQIQLFNAAYNGLSERDGGSASFASGTTTTRSLFGNAQDTPQLIDGPRWGELKGDPAIGLTIYSTPGSYTTSWGTQRMRQLVIDFATALHNQIPGYVLRANDISKREGGPHPFHHGHQVGREVDLTHPDQPDGDNKQWIADRKAELKVLSQFKERISFIYSTQQVFLDYGKSLGLPMKHSGGHEGHFHVAVKAWTG